MNDLVKSALEEEGRLLQRLDAVRQLLNAYGIKHSVKQDLQYQTASTLAGVAPGFKPSTSVRQPSETTSRSLAIVRRALAKSDGRPIPIRVLLSEVEGDGVKISGKNAISSLSAILSKAKDLRSHGKKGWTLISPDGAEQKEETSISGENE